jgi:hypothetical protein
LQGESANGNLHRNAGLNERLAEPEKSAFNSRWSRARACGRVIR